MNSIDRSVPSRSARAISSSQPRVEVAAVGQAGQVVDARLARARGWRPARSGSTTTCTRRRCAAAPCRAACTARPSAGWRAAGRRRSIRRRRSARRPASGRRAGVAAPVPSSGSSGVQVVGLRRAARSSRRWPAKPRSLGMRWPTHVLDARAERGDVGQARRGRARQLGARVVQQDAARLGGDEVVGALEDLAQRRVEPHVPVLGVLVAARAHEEAGDLLGRQREDRPGRDDRRGDGQLLGARAAAGRRSGCGGARLGRVSS